MISMRPISPLRRCQMQDLRSRLRRTISGMNGGRRGRSRPSRRNGKCHTTTIKPVLDRDGSAALRDQLLTDVDRLSSADAAAAWAHRIMAAKNSLAAADARRVEEAFAAKMAILGSGDGEVIDPPLSSPEPDQPRLPQNPRAAEPGEVSVANRVDKSLLALPEPRRFRDKTHCQIRVQATLSDLWAPAGGCPSPSVRAASCARAQGQRRIHRPAVPRPSSRGAPIAVMKPHGGAKPAIDPIGAARTLWTETHPLRSVAEAPNPDQSMAARAATSNSTPVPRFPNGTRNRKTKPITAADAQ